MSTEAMQNARNERFHDNSIRSDGDIRTSAQRDRDRILHSEALRRLANVTQVVDPAEGHVFHNRLTHTLKVAQIARRLAEKLKSEQPDLADEFGLDPDVVEAAALAHDLGHPPFGHVAEQELDKLVREQGGVADGYEGNPQSFRILTKLEVRTKDVPGLDLTRATLNAVLKYPRLRQTQGEGNKKWAAYGTEKQQFDWVRHGFPEGLRSLEAEIMDWADDIAFSVHDVEDFYRAALIPPIIFSDEAPILEQRAYFNEILSHWKPEKRNDRPPVTEDWLREEFRKFRPLLPFAVPFTHTKVGFGNLRTTTSTLIDRYINGIRIRQAARTATKDDEKRTIEFNENIRTEIRLLKGLTWRYVIHNRALATQQYGKQRVIRELFIIYLDALSSEDREAKFILPEDYLSQLKSIEDDLDEEDELKRKKQAYARLTADIISAMNDNETLVMHKKLTGMAPGSVLERLFH